MLRRVLAVTALLAVALVCLPPKSLALQLVAKSLDDLGSEAEQVLVGHVADVRSYWNEAGTKILTETIVDVDRRWKGGGPGRVSVIQMGGTVGTVRMTVSGALPWRSGEEVVLFLEPSFPGTYRVSGFSQGKFEVQRENGEIFVTRAPLGEAKLVGDDGVARDSGGRGMRLRLDDLMQRALQIQEGGK